MTNLEKIRISLVIILVFQFQLTFAQSPDSTALVTEGMGKPDEASASVIGNRKAKGIEINYTVFPAFDITSASKFNGLDNAEGEFKTAKAIEFKLKIPLVLKSRTKIITGLKYKYEEYKFKEPEEIEYALYKNLQEKHLRSINLDFYLSRSLPNYHFFLSKVGLQLNGDFGQDSHLPFTRFIKYTASGLYGWKQDKYTSYGFGLYLSYTFGRPRIYPAFLWNKTFNERWGIEALLPANFFFRYNISEKSILLAGYDVEGDSYHIVVDDPPLSEIKTLELRKSDIKLLLTYEQEIYDFLWFSVSAGYRFNINFNLSEDNEFSNDIILKNNIENSPFLNFSIFVVPPKKLATKFNKEIK